ncbi:hypothetical protein BCO26_0873 [Heyndrickxia coagulans 2-6]|nr:hypothetical protein BCO26_0873 [Heyndrickxia coagulans 2-6]
MSFKQSAHKPCHRGIKNPGQPPDFYSQIYVIRLYLLNQIK